MTEVLLWIIAATVIGSLIGLSGGFIVLWKAKFAKKIALGLISFAAGTLLAAAFFHILPESIEEAGTAVIPFVLVGIAVFYIFERILIWHHCRDHKYNFKPMPYNIILGDSLHNFIDGIIIAGAFLVNIPLGIIVAVAVMLHEIPQEIGEFGVLLYSKMKKKKIIFYNILSAFAALAGALITFFLLQGKIEFVPYLEAFAAGGFIYIAGVDLIPETHKERNRNKLLMSAGLFFAGMAIIWLAGHFLHA